MMAPFEMVAVIQPSSLAELFCFELPVRSGRTTGSCVGVDDAVCVEFQGAFVDVPSEPAARQPAGERQDSSAPELNSTYNLAFRTR
ncbi:hypothetical protein [Curtobacterium sp. ISL-83]|uniref:hypothetical protein n=1 Tax=Curtobacterium sp. ISL-83 TaxID=2819145 RepID=UPI001BE82640|nr:hypothetical protein [Curtobacterium sp. ISL-83]MBT2502830.1 hypothetical protein [Curtobacterium sp. ISL-83]